MARYVLDKLAWMRTEGIWPNGQRYLWTDAFGVVLLISLHAELGERRYLDQAEWVVAEVDRVLGRPGGIRIGEAPDRDGQYFHYLAMWLYALSILGRHLRVWRARCLRRHDKTIVDLATEFHSLSPVARIRSAQILVHLPDDATVRLCLLPAPR